MAMHQRKGPNISFGCRARAIWMLTAVEHIRRMKQSSSFKVLRAGSEKAEFDQSIPRSFVIWMMSSKNIARQPVVESVLDSAASYLGC